MTMSWFEILNRRRWGGTEDLYQLQLALQLLVDLNVVEDEEYMEYLEGVV
jgi:hypothetical protein